MKVLGGLVALCWGTIFIFYGLPVLIGGWSGQWASTSWALEATPLATMLVAVQVGYEAWLKGKARLWVLLTAAVVPVVHLILIRYYLFPVW